MPNTPFPQGDASASLIPGAYERNTLTHRQPGGMTGAAYGTDGLPEGGGTMSATTIAEHEKEGGGGISQRPRHETHVRSPVVVSHSRGDGGHD